MKKLFTLLLLIIILISCTQNAVVKHSNQNITIEYVAENTTNIINPERGWYFSFTPPCCDVPPDDIKPPRTALRLQELQEMRN